MRLRPFHVVAVLAIGLGVWQLIARAWICDDAFITFRYADNLVNGHGLVFNPGDPTERVEGYSNFLWTLLCAGGIALGFDPVPFSQVLGGACFVGCLLLLLGLSTRVWGARPALPVAALGLALHRHFLDYGTGGLETMAFTLLMTALALRVVSASTGWHWLGAGMLAAALTMTRPEGFGFAFLTLFFAARYGSWRHVVLALLPLAGFVLPWFLWRWGFYGYPLPNTFYAKSAADGWVLQGLTYVWMFFRTYWFLVPVTIGLPLFGAICLLRRSGDPHRRPRIWAVLGGFVAAQLVFVLWVGGDFMFGRFLVPVTPLLYAGWEMLVVRALPPAPDHQVSAVAKTQWGLGVFLVLATLFPWTFPDLEEQRTLNGIGDERVMYPPSRVRENREFGRQLGEALAGTDAKVVYFGSQAMLVYEGRLPYAIEGTTGLTDPFLAHVELDERGRIGHEKGIYGQPEYLLEQSPDLLLEYRSSLFASQPFTKARILGRDVTLFSYRPEIVERLRRLPDTELVDFPEWLDAFTAGIPESGAAGARAALPSIELFYFRHNRDPERKRALRRALR